MKTSPLTFGPARLEVTPEKRAEAIRVAKESKAFWKMHPNGRMPLKPLLKKAMPYSYSVFKYAEETAPEVMVDQFIAYWNDSRTTSRTKTDDGGVIFRPGPKHAAMVGACWTAGITDVFGCGQE